MKILCCPECFSGADANVTSAFCRTCGNSFPISEGVYRERREKRGKSLMDRLKETKTRKEKYHGEKAGRRVIPAYKWDLHT